jgi:hypothetical protein
VPVLLNGDAVTGTRWLADGDEIGIGGARIRCAVADGALAFSLNFSGVDYDTLPPEQAGEVPPAAVTASRLAPTKATAGHRPRSRTVVIASALLVLVAAAVWLLTSTAVLIATDPAGARIEIRGAPDLRLGGRYLLRPGRYTVAASATAIRRHAGHRGHGGRQPGLPAGGLPDVLGRDPPVVEARSAWTGSPSAGRRLPDWRSRRASTASLSPRHAINPGKAR